MSCHDIGKGLNSVVKVVTKLFDEETISLNVARDIIYSCRRAVHYCDGNEDEAIESIYDNRCGKCLCKMKNDEYLFNVYHMFTFSCRGENMPDVERIMNNGNVKLASPKLCEKCFKEAINEYYKDENAGQKMIDYYIKHLDRDDYICQIDDNE